MLLTITNSGDATADYLIDVLRRKSVECIRFDTDKSLMGAQFRWMHGQPELKLGGCWYRPSHFTNVWYRRPERLQHPGLDESGESKLLRNEWSEALENFFSHIPNPKWMNTPSANVAASHKLEQLAVASQMDLTVPPSLVTQDPAELTAFFQAHDEMIVVKPLAVGYVERPETGRDSLIYTSEVRKEHLDDLSDLHTCPTYFQALIRKVADLRITMIDGSCHAVELVATDVEAPARCDIRRDNMASVRYRAITLPSDVEGKLRTMVAHYGLRFAAIDMGVTESGAFVFFEINPNGQWAWLDLCGASNIAESFAEAFSR